MARGKKKETLTPEDRLQAALVPESEQPYKVPGNWCWVSLQTIDQYRASSTDPSKYPDTLFELYSVPSSADNYPEIVSGCEIGSTKQSVQKGDVLLCKINPRINRVWKVSQYTGNALLASSEWIIIRNSKIVSDYLMYCFRAPYFREYMLSNVSGVGGSLMRAQPKYVKTYPVPLPPLPEQQRIVDRIESLFARLDEAKQKAQDALDSFETRKAAILHKAFTGELTAQWRKEHGVGMESWENVYVSEICHSLKYGTAKKSSSEGTVVVIRMGNLQDGEISWDDLAYSNDEEDIEKYKLVPGDVLFNRTNSPALVGKTSIYRGEYPAIYAGYLIKLDYDRSRVIGDYLNYSLNTVSAKEYCNSVKTDGVNQSNINAKKIGAYRFDMPKINEQSEIIHILDDLLAKERQAKEAAQGVLEQIDLIKKAILARAFRGELGTNDPSEESAIKLLERSFSGTIEIEKVKTKQVAKQKAEVIFMSKTIMEALSKGVRLTPENLKSETELPIDDFYARLKELIDNGSVVESRENGESYLEAGNENRQAENQ